MKNPLTPSGIEPATSRFVAQRLNHCATVVPFACSTKHNVEFLAWVPCILEDTGEDYVRDWLSWLRFCVFLQSFSGKSQDST